MSSQRFPRSPSWFRKKGWGPGEGKEKGRGKKREVNEREGKGGRERGGKEEGRKWLPNLRTVPTPLTSTRLALIITSARRGL